MCTTRINAKKLQGPNFHLLIVAESRKNRAISETAVRGDEKLVKLKWFWSNRG